MLVDLFALIGQNYSPHKPTPITQVVANCSPSWLILRATILRRLIESESISDLVLIIDKLDDSSFVALLVLWQRFLPPYPSQKVTLTTNGKIVTLTGMDYQSCHFKTEFCVDFSILAVNYNKFVFFNPHFAPILPKKLSNVSKELSR